VNLYYEYLSTRDDNLRRLMLLHNSDDILQLSRILKVFDILDLHEIATHMGFPVVDAESVLFVDRIRLSNNSLEFSGRYKLLNFDYIIFNEAFQASFKNDDHSFYVKLPCFRESDCVITDLAELEISSEGFKDPQYFQNDYLILRNKTKINYEVMNKLIKLTLKRIIEKMKS